MVKVANFYIDDSGPRHPDNERGTKAAHGYDWFALGGVLLKRCMGGYNPQCVPYKRLLEDGKLIEVGMPQDDIPMLGTKYYCFESVGLKGTAAPASAPSPNKTGPSN